MPRRKTLAGKAAVRHEVLCHSNLLRAESTWYLVKASDSASALRLVVLFPLCLIWRWCMGKAGQGRAYIGAFKGLLSDLASPRITSTSVHLTVSNHSCLFLRATTCLRHLTFCWPDAVYCIYTWLQLAEIKNLLHSNSRLRRPVLLLMPNQACPSPAFYMNIFRRRRYVPASWIYRNSIPPQILLFVSSCDEDVHYRRPIPTSAVICLLRSQSWRRPDVKLRSCSCIAPLMAAVLQFPRHCRFSPNLHLRRTHPDRSKQPVYTPCPLPCLGQLLLQ